MKNYHEPSGIHPGPVKIKKIIIRSDKTLSLIIYAFHLSEDGWVNSLKMSIAEKKRWLVSRIFYNWHCFPVSELSEYHSLINLPKLAKGLYS